MIRAGLWQLVIVFVGSALLTAVSTQFAMSFGVGGLLVALNFLVLGFAWNLIFQKKLIAVAVSLIVFKYAILGIIIYKLVTQDLVNPLGFTLGIASFALSAVLYVLTTKERP